MKENGERLEGVTDKTAAAWQWISVAYAALKAFIKQLLKQELEVKAGDTGKPIRTSAQANGRDGHISIKRRILICM